MWTLRVKRETDYLVELSATIDQGRMKVSVEDANGRTYVSEILEPLEVKQPAEQPVQTIRLPFVSLEKRYKLISAMKHRTRRQSSISIQ